MIKDNGLGTIKMITQEQLNVHHFDEPEKQSQHLADAVAEILSTQISNKGFASIAVSGGSTPKRLFDLLSQTELEWDKVTITLVDDRWLENSHNDSNQRLVEETLLQNNAITATFIPLFQAGSNAFDACSKINDLFEQVNLPFDIVLLGMGNDGHTASLFPCSAQVTEGLLTEKTYLATQPTSAPYERISLSANAIENAGHLFLQLKGSDKQLTLNKALKGDNEQDMPIRRFLNQNITVLWCP